ncbi:MAG: hypothetical protein QW763_01275 [Archaeoglobaceae archaeon]
MGISGRLSDKDYCVGILADDVVLDGQGFSITGTGDEREFMFRLTTLR